MSLTQIIVSSGIGGAIGFMKVNYDIISALSALPVKDSSLSKELNFVYVMTLRHEGL